MEGSSVDADDSCVGGVDLASGLKALQVAVDLMNNNQYHQAVALLKPRSGTSMYHSMAYGSVLFLQAVFCMEREAIENATDVLMKTVELCNSCRRPRGMMESISGWVFGQRLEDHTPSELQAEVFYAEANLLLSFLTFLQDESLMSFVKGGLRVRSCYSSYKQLYQWLDTCLTEGQQVEENFATGVRMGFGCFNLFLSLLPARVLKVLEFVGFGVERAIGLAELEKAASSSTFRAPLCTSFLLCYYSMAAVITGIEMNPDHAQRLLEPQLAKYPNSVQFLFFQGRVAAMRGDMDKALQSFQAAVDAQTEWRQVCHICWWEMAWCHSLKSEWEAASRYCHRLYVESKWSKASFLYMKSSFLLMHKDLVSLNQRKASPSGQGSPSCQKSFPPGQTDQVSSPSSQTGQTSSASGEESPSGQESSPSHQTSSLSDKKSPSCQQPLSSSQGPAGEDSGPVSEEELADMMRKIPTLKQRIAGKSLPIEKFAVAKSDRFLSGAHLPLSGMELLYSHNALLLLHNNHTLLQKHLQQVWRKLLELEATKDSNAGYHDDWAVVTFIQGCIFRILERHDEAEICFLDVINKASVLQHDLYTVPAAYAELGLLHISTGKLEEAQRCLECARANYKGYHLESRIHFRIHAGLNRITELRKLQH